MAPTSPLTEARLSLLYDADGFGGEKTMRAKVIRDLIDEIRALRRELAALNEPSDPAYRHYLPGRG